MLRILGLHAGYGDRAVLGGVDLAVERGELLALIGPNGCGKTTLLRVISGAHAPAAGAVAIDGEDVRAMPPAARARRIAVVAQSGLLPDGFSAFEAVLMGRTPHLRLLQSEGPRDAAAVRSAMERAACWDLRDRPVQELSGGERQRVLIARALAQEPALLLLDEPTSHLDISHQVETFQLLVALCRGEGLAVVAVVHDLTLAAMFADRVALLSNGRIVADGSPEAVLREDLLSAAYGLPVRILRHPDSGHPIVVPDAATPAAYAGAGDVGAQHAAPAAGADRRAGDVA